MNAAVQTPLVEMKDISIAFGGIKAVDHASSRPLSRRGRRPARPQRRRQVLPDQDPVRRLQARRRANPHRGAGSARSTIPRDAKNYGIETIYQTLALADNVDAASNLYLGRELLTAWGTLDDGAMESEARKVMGRLNPNFRRFKEPVIALSGGQRQSVAIARAIHFNASILIMDEPTAALGPAETAQVGELVKQLKSEGHRHLSHQPRHSRRVRSRGPRDGDEKRADRRLRPRLGHDQGRSARDDHSRQMPSRRDSGAGGDEELIKISADNPTPGIRSARNRARALF